METSRACLIVGLGNPGEKYAKTRHNAGFMVLNDFAHKLGWNFKRQWKLQGKVAEGIYKNRKTYLLQPNTYMNLSGLAVKKCADFFKVGLNELLIVVDDVYLSFSTLRLRSKGSCGGHNGLKSIEKELGSQNFSRLRIGVGNKELPELDLEKFVLGEFARHEQSALPLLFESAGAVLECWLGQGEEAASQLATDLSKKMMEL